MNISGVTNNCVITANSPFILTGDTITDSSTINITDENGMNVESCFGLSTEVIEFTGDTTNSGSCNNVLEIIITDGVVDEVICDFTGYTQQENGLILLTYSGGNTSLNVHPECCTSLDSNYVPEIGDENYYVCRWREEFDATDCNNYIYDNTLDINDYAIFNISTGGTTTIVPSAECCYEYNLVDEITTEGVKCKEPIIPVCADYVLENEAPEVGDAEFTVVSTGEITTIVPTLECCTINGLSGREVTGGYSCYKSLNPPSVNISLDSLCCETTLPPVDDMVNHIDLQCGSQSTFNVNGGQTTVQVSTASQDTTSSWTLTIDYISPSVGWIFLDKFSGVGSDTVTISIIDSTTISNTQTATRTARIVMTNDNDPNNTQYCTINQTYYINSDGLGDGLL